jgi:lysophospholipase L1-like esterase
MPVSLEDVGGMHGNVLRQFLSVGHKSDGTLVGGAGDAREASVVLLGDSITAANILYPGAGWANGAARGYWSHANMLLRNRLLLLANAGVGGNTTAMILARVGSDVLPYSPGVCVVQGGGNDITTDAASTSTIIANLTAIYQQLGQAGILVVATTVLPSVNVNTVARRQQLVDVNYFIQNYATQNSGVVLCDWYSRVANATTGDPLAAAVFDGVHPTQFGAYLIGQQLAATLSPLFPIRDPLPFSNGEVGGLPNPMMIGNTAGVATSVTIAALSGSPTMTPTKVARTDGLQGEWQQIVISGGTDGVYVQQRMTPDTGGGYFSVGDWVYAVCEVEIDPGAAMMGKTGERPAEIWLHNNDAPGLPIVNALFAGGAEGTYPGAVPTGRLVFRTFNYQLPVGTNKLFLRAVFYVNGTVRVGRMQIRKATASSNFG